MMGARAVLVVSNHGEIVGGGEISLLTLLKGLDRSRWTPIAVVPFEGPVASGCRALGIPVHTIPLPRLRRPGAGILRSLAALVRLVKGSGAGLLHANGSRAMFYAGLAGWLSRRPVIWHVRVADRDGLWDRLLAGLARLIIVNSKAVESRFAWVPSSKVRCIYNGVDLAVFRPCQPVPTLRHSIGLPEGGPVIVSVGRFVTFKGYEYLLEAAKLLQPAMPEVHWVLVGDGELKGALEQRCRNLGVEAHVHFIGWREDIPDLLALCDVFALPSLSEHFGRVLIEAMAMAKPVVATDAGGVPEIVIHGETGLLVPPAEPKPFADAVSYLLNNPMLASRMGLAGRRRVEAEFSLERHAAAVQGVYQEIVEGTGACPR